MPAPPLNFLDSAFIYNFYPTLNKITRFFPGGKAKDIRFCVGPKQVWFEPATKRNEKYLNLKERLKY